MTCGEVTEFGSCIQKVGGTCPFHRAYQEDGFRVDRYYHEKIVRGLLIPTGVYLSSVELDTMFDGRRRFDGRRVDQYVSS